MSGPASSTIPVADAALRPVPVAAPGRSPALAVTGPAFGLRAARWTGDWLELIGHAHPRDRATSRRTAALTALILRPADGGAPVRVRAHRRYLPEVTDDSGQARFNHDWAGFTALIDPARLRPGDWTVQAALLNGLRRQRGPLAPYWCGSGEYPPAHWIDRDVRVVPYFGEYGLHLRVEPVRARFTGVRALVDGLEFTGLAVRCSEGTVLRLRHRQSPTELTFPLRVTGGQGFTVRVPFAPFRPVGPGEPGQPGQPEHWEPELLRPDGTADRVVMDDRAAALTGQHPLDGSGQVLYVKQLADGYAQFCTQSATARIDGITIEGAAFHLTASAPPPGDGPLELVLRHSDGTDELRHPVVRAEPLRVRLPTTAALVDGREPPLRKGIWELRLRPEGRPEAEQPLILSPGVLASLPLMLPTGPGAKQIALQRRWHDTLILDSTPVLAAAERSAHAQQRLRTTAYPAARRRPLRDAVLYDVFGGRGYADSPRAVHAELARRSLPLEHLWVVDDGQAQLPPGVRAVRSHSPEWYEALATSRYLVGNTHFPDVVERRPGQVIVQTWHGAPLKRIAHDVENAWLGDHGYLAALESEAPHWSLLVSPSPFATPIMRRAFRYPGEILESGYPRNDLLARGADPSPIRRRLGIPEDKRVVLYAPTWREDRQRGDHFALDLRLDPDAARTALADDHVLLVRPHAHVREALPGAGDGFLYNVCDYPDVQDLLLITDVLVTDYSSIVFDFAITGRPVLFFAYDLDHYRDTLRGFYFDFQHEAPGPLLRTSDELLAALRDLTASDRIPTRYALAYDTFRSTHCALDDGSASARVVDRMLELGTVDAANA